MISTLALIGIGATALLAYVFGFAAGKASGKAEAYEQEIFGGKIDE
jgi:hypothetical protein